MRKDLVVAIDGTAASGKSTTAKIVAKKLGYLYIDTGAMYRAIALKALRRGISFRNRKMLSKMAEETEVTLRNQRGKLRVYLDGEDVTFEIRSPEVGEGASLVSTVSGVRRRLVSWQRLMGKKGGVVLEGRDIGTVVFPDADLKIYMDALPKERARRRQKELQAGGKMFPLSQVKKELLERDRRDRTRKDSPLRRAEGAYLLDTTYLTIREQSERVLKEIRRLQV